MSRRRCNHGFAQGINCDGCNGERRIARRLETRRKAIEAAIARTRVAPFGCALCGGDHLSKHCTATPTGRHRSARAQNPGLVAIESGRERIARAG